MARRRDLQRAVLIGAATGMRSQVGLAAAVLRLPPYRLPPRLRSPLARRLTIVAAAGELVADKVPRIPDRLLPAPFAARVALGAFGAQLVGGPPLLGAVVAAVSTKVTHDLRGAAARRIPPVAAALAEDAAAITLAAVATRSAGA